MLQRLAYSFAAGDMFTVILRGNGDMIEAWGRKWDMDIPDQEQMKTLIRNLNAWRLKAGKDFLVSGRMMKPIPFEGSSNIPMVSKSDGLPIKLPSVFTSNWQSQDGRKAQFFVNYLPDEKEITVDMSALKDITVHHNSSGTEGEKTESGELTIKLPALSAVMVSYSGSI